MKKSISVLLLALIVFSALSAQKTNNVPDVVKQAFSKRYPNQEASWQKEKHTYVAKFTEHGKDAIVHFNSRGRLTAREWFIIYSELPEAAVIYLNKYYGGERSFSNILKVENRKGELFYKARTGNSEIVFDAKGIFIKKQRARN